MQPVAIVTGGTYGIGRAISAALAQDHAIARSYFKTAPQDALEGNTNVLSLQADLSDPNTAEQLVATTLERFGRIDVIVNNAGTVALTPKESFDPAAHRAILDMNLLAPMSLLSAALPHLQRGASVINISSINATLPPRDGATYGASKAGLNLWTRAMAKELGPQGIRVNAIAPGAINVPENPRDSALTEVFVKETALGRIGEPEDIARVVRFLASPDAGFITGEVITVSGGYRL